MGHVLKGRAQKGTEQAQRWKAAPSCGSDGVESHLSFRKQIPDVGAPPERQPGMSSGCGWKGRYCKLVQTGAASLGRETWPAGGHVAASSHPTRPGDAGLLHSEEPPGGPGPEQVGRWAVPVVPQSPQLPPGHPGAVTKPPVDVGPVSTEGGRGNICATC